MKKILVPVDFSDASLAALDLACSIARKSNSAVIALHVVEGISSKSFAIFEEGEPDFVREKMYTHKLLKRSEELLTQLVKSPKYSAVQLSMDLRVGNPFHSIRTLTAKQKIDLVVMGIKGRAQWEGMIIGSNTEKVMRSSNIPVLTNRYKLSVVRFKRIVYATTLSADEKYFSPTVKEIQKLYRSKIYILRVNTLQKFESDGEVTKRLKKFAVKLKLENYTINTYNDFSEETGIVNFARSVEADMIAVPSRGRSRFVRLLSGSIAEGVMNRCEIPTLAYAVKQ